MSRKRKGRAGWHQATSKLTNINYNFTGFDSRLKAVIVFLAVWGLLSVSMAGWIIRRCRIGGS